MKSNDISKWLKHFGINEKNKPHFKRKRRKKRKKKKEYSTDTSGSLRRAIKHVRNQGKFLRSKFHS